MDPKFGFNRLDPKLWIFKELDPKLWIQDFGSKQMGVPFLGGGGATPNTPKKIGGFDATQLAQRPERQTPELRWVRLDAAASLASYTQPKIAGGDS